jgi:Zn-dependent protease
LIIINANLAVFNLLPFPPLDGSKIFTEILGGRAADLIYRMERY